MNNDGFVLISVVINHNNYIDEGVFLKVTEDLGYSVCRKVYLHHKFYNILERPFLKIYKHLYLNNQMIYTLMCMFLKRIIDNLIIYKTIIFFSRLISLEKSKSHLILLLQNNILK